MHNRRRRLVIAGGLSLAILVFFSYAVIAAAHRSGCHRWHSCPSDSGSYICGDTGRCSGCPDNNFCENRKPRVTTKTPKQSVPILPSTQTDAPKNSFQPTLKEETIFSKETKTILPKKYLEADYRDFACKQLEGNIEYALDDGSRVDCLTDQYAIEFDFAKKWAEAIGQSLYYAEKTGKQPGIILIIPTEKDMRHMEKIKKVVKAKKLNIKLWSIRPNALKGNNIQ